MDREGCCPVAMTTTRMYRLDRGGSCMEWERKKNMLCKKGAKLKQNKQKNLSHTIRPPGQAECLDATHVASVHIRWCKYCPRFQHIRCNKRQFYYSGEITCMMQPLFPRGCGTATPACTAKSFALGLRCCVTHHTSSNQYQRLILQSAAGAGNRIQTVSNPRLERANGGRIRKASQTSAV